jgi:hypothetical protein
MWYSHCHGEKGTATHAVKLRKAPRQKRSADTVAVWLSNNLVMDLLKQIRRRMETAGMSRRQLLASSAIVLAHAALSKTALAQTKTEVSGEYYDWQKTMKPETPWLRDYSQIYQSGLFLCERDGDGAIKKVYLTFEQALDAMRKIDNLTLGIPKIIFLVGWQFNGHDSGYPSWSVVNEHLKRPQDATALDSLKWLMVSAREYHTTVTLHINMFDAYRDSPLWKVYDESNIIIKDAHGEPIEGPRYDDMQSYQISYAQDGS